MTGYSEICARWPKYCRLPLLLYATMHCPCAALSLCIAPAAPLPPIPLLLPCQHCPSCPSCPSCQHCSCCSSATNYSAAALPALPLLLPCPSCCPASTAPPAPAATTAPALPISTPAIVIIVTRKIYFRSDEDEGKKHESFHRPLGRFFNLSPNLRLNNRHRPNLSHAKPVNKPPNIALQS